MKKVIEKLKAQSSQISKKVDNTPKKPEEIKEEPQEEEFEGEVEEEQEEVKPKKKEAINIPEKQEIQDEELKKLRAIQIEIERLQNNGVFRAEILFQLQSINQTLMALVELLMKTTENEGK